MSKTNKPAADLTYEQAFSELEEIVEKMETEQQPLDEAMSCFERGQMLAKYCAALLDNAELRIKQLNPNKSAPEKSA
jgi:exodeoxyribonuclease VII small subunit